MPGKGLLEMLRGGKVPEHDMIYDNRREEPLTTTRQSHDRSERHGMSRRQFLVRAGLSAAFLLGGLSAAEAEDTRIAKIGFIFPEKGPHASEAKSFMAGFQLFFKEAGMDKPPVEIVRKDPGPKDEKALQCLTELMTDKDVRFVVGPLTLKGSEQVVHGVGTANVLFFIVNPEIRLVSGEMCLPLSFRISANTYQCAQPLAGWAVKNVGTRIFITGSDDTPANEEADFFANSFDKAGGTFVDRMMAEASGIKGVLTALSKSDANSVFAAFSGETAGTFFKEYRKFSPPLKHHIIGPGSLMPFPQSSSEIKEIPPGVKTLSCIKNPAELVDRIKKTLKTEVSDVVRAAEGFDLAAVITRAVQSLPAEGSDLTGAIRVIEEMEIQGPRGKIRFDKNHEPILDTFVQEWEFAGPGPKQKILDDLGSCQTPDFGCGRIGFPRRPDSEIQEEEPLFDQNEN